MGRSRRTEAQVIANWGKSAGMEIAVYRGQTAACGQKSDSGYRIDRSFKKGESWNDLPQCVKHPVN